jgi:hypothetical protein
LTANREQQIILGGRRTDVVNNRTLTDLANAPTLEAAEGGGARLAPGAQVGRLLVIDVLGQGGMGVVYRAYDPKLDRKVAVKLLQ